MKKIRDFLLNLGLTETEINIYVKLLEVGRCSVSEIARTLNMNRVTAHFTIQGLIDKGLITHVKEGRSRELTAQPPDALQYLIERKDKEVKSLHEQFTGTLPLLTGLMPHTASDQNNFEVKHFQGANGIRAIYKEVLKSSDLQAYVNAKGIISLMPENLSLFPQAVSYKNINMREILEDSDESRAYVKNMSANKYRYKFFPTSIDVTVFDYLIFDGKIAMISGNKELNGLLVVNNDLYQNAKALFDMLWKLLPEQKSA